MESEENKNVLEVVKKLLVKKNQIHEKWPSASETFRNIHICGFPTN